VVVAASKHLSSTLLKNKAGLCKLACRATEQHQNLSSQWGMHGGGWREMGCLVVRVLFMPEAWLSVWEKTDGSNFKGQEPADCCILIQNSYGLASP